MIIIGHRQIKPDWHMLTNMDGVFFGYTEEQVREKAAAKRRQNTLAIAERTRHLQLLERQRNVAVWGPHAS